MMSRQEIKSEITGTVWKILTTPQQDVAEGDTLMILESMKMEIPVIVEDGGVVVEITVAEGDAIQEGQVVAIVET
ncbi:acetyl-CoA carboxylase biotin carboxyl carrier protein subunit [Xanthobacter tagetidis]|uniref:Acetyl-CoA carboxylase biotin carboxyl carrier protein subunit n=2 Tax=Xanthobacter tagetidis TaxID=60216 RepID=A0A3L7AFI4_9HYPH|nr:acetyl-CoA carboxylase biotin carboxyl carrier protein subunit [Xanthobacter tagetidis]